MTKIAVIGQEPKNAGRVVETLRRLGYEAVNAVPGAENLAAEAPDLILAGAVPEEPGAAAAFAEWRGRGIPILFAADQADASVLERALSAGSSGLLLMSFPDEVWRSGIELALARAAAAKSWREKTEDLARSNRELEQFAHMASHDLQEPLVVISNFISLLAMHAQGKLDAKEVEYLKCAEKGAGQAQRFVRRMLEYAKAGSRVRPETVDFEVLFQQQLRDLKLAVLESGAEVTHDPLPKIEADPFLMAQLFQNLLLNALRFRRPEELPRIHVSAGRKNGEWVFSIADNGVGIDPKRQGDIFSLFRRLRPASHDSVPGLGLAVAKKIIDRHGGRIWLESEPGKGSTFYFSLPQNVLAAIPDTGSAAAKG
ncbi:MAG TPA: ATP-binding protein [Verrucomicrobiae bacterium]|nr:ATP-binding protein [Verrucomicrobiae bacterium]